MSAQLWHPTDAAVAVNCDGCSRGVPASLRVRGKTLEVSLATVPEGGDTTGGAGADGGDRRDDTAAHSAGDPGDPIGPVVGHESTDGDPESDADADERTYCEHCAAEVTELTDGMVPVAHGDAESVTDALRSADVCELCEDTLDRPASGVGVGHHGARGDSVDRYPLCAGCDAIFLEFLGNVPKESPEADALDGDATATRVSIEEADRDSLVRAFDGLGVGDEVRLESQEDAGENESGTYHVVEGEVVDRDAGLGIEDYVVRAADGRYRLTRPAPTVDRLTLRWVGGEDPVQLGEVTVLEAETAQAAQGAEPDAATESDSGVVELDVDSALVPDRIDVGSSAD